MLIGMPPIRRADAFGNTHVERDGRGLARFRDPGVYVGKHRQYTDDEWLTKLVLHDTPVGGFLRWVETNFRAPRWFDV